MLRFEPDAERGIIPIASGAPKVSRSHQGAIRRKLHAGVLVSDEDWRAIQETLYLSSIPGMKESIVKGLKTPISKYAKGLDCGSCN